MQEQYLLIVEKREKSSVFFMCLGENLERKRGRIYLKNGPKLPRIPFFFFFLIRGGFGGIYRQKVTFQL